jgi:predicted flap endonuclease-1-like 5' DNA nuclease
VLLSNPFPIVLVLCGGESIMQVRYATARWIAILIIIVGVIAAIAGFVSQGGNVLSYDPTQVLVMGIIWVIVGLLLLLWILSPKDEPGVDLSVVNRMEGQIRGFDGRFKDIDARLDAKVGDVDARFGRRFGDYDARLGALEAAPRTFAKPAGPDDLKRIEGIGPKMEQALKAAGIDTFLKLSQANEGQIRNAIEAAGMSFAPSVPTWARQAQYLVDGDEEGFALYQEQLTAGRG